ncbi:hypothetical protein [Lysobacter capsici]|uniref:hypothetical protein n=1 Tax=Lysobacter capsici TaxID=435897 RepID=UPI001C002B3C|nr:hypothetical protein [Lysobacter capsici]QWF18581.1 hypothetical protein KME82_07495 [Lysobacter capsici]
MNWLARIFVSAVVRRIAFVLVAFLLSIAGISASRAQGTDSTCSRSGDVDPSIGCKDQGMASAAALASLADSIKRSPSPSYPDMVPCGFDPDNTISSAVRVIACISPTNSYPVRSRTRYYDKPCSERQSLPVSKPIDITFGDVVCGGGCEYKMQPLERKTFETVGRDDIITAKGNHVPTGKACLSPPTPPKKPPPDKVCSETLGGHLFCTKDNGDICVTSANTGRTYCGPPTDGTNATNPERTENVTIGPASPTPTPPAPPTPRPGEDWKPGERASITNNTSNNSNSITINNNAGTPNTGSGNGNPGDGSGNPGTPGSGTGTGQGDSEPSGSAGSGVGTLYSQEPMTASEALGAYATAALNSPIAQTARDFFGNCAYSGSCPVWSYDGGPMLGVLTFDGFCSPALNELLTWAGYIVMATAAFAAFRIAFY